ncbi:unnamed protein product [Paramecium sonneborni]|uniref:Uncharacterized protein n=1 Tax=Paramecium sonneborni TaxID=65129 RepID=A0A8S1R622_9CILI|nr:unnamed protein product [Paramecium sonneborni]
MDKSIQKISDHKQILKYNIPNQTNVIHQHESQKIILFKKISYQILSIKDQVKILIKLFNELGKEDKKNVVFFNYKITLICYYFVDHYIESVKLNQQNYNLNYAYAQQINKIQQMLKQNIQNILLITKQNKIRQYQQKIWAINSLLKICKI